MKTSTNTTQDQALQQIQSGEVLVISNRCKGGLIVRKPFYAEFMGPGAIVGGNLDRDCTRVIPLGHFSLKPPSDQDELYRSYLIRRQWILNTARLTELSDPEERAQQLLNELASYFSSSIIRRVPIADLAAIVGVFPCTIAKVKHLI